MKLPNQSKPVQRTASYGNAANGIFLSACPPGIPSGELGTCIIGGDHPTRADRFNCAACCAHRDALSWFNGNRAVNC